MATFFSKSQSVRVTQSAKDRGLASDFGTAIVVSTEVVPEDDQEKVGHRQIVTLDNGERCSGYLLELVQIEEGADIRV